MAFVPVPPEYTRYEYAMNDIIGLAGQVLDLARKENPGVNVIVRPAVFTDWGYTSATGQFSLAASSLSTVTIASGTVSTGQVLAPYSIVLTSLPSGVTLYYMDIYVGGQRVARYDLSSFMKAVSGDQPSVIYIPAEYSVIITQQQSYSIQLVAYNSNTAAVNVGIQLQGLVGEQNGRTVTINV